MIMHGLISLPLMISRSYSERMLLAYYIPSVEEEQMRFVYL